MRTPLRELIRSLLRGEPPRADRRSSVAASVWAVDVSCTGTVLAVRQERGSLVVELDGTWTLTELDDAGIPVAVATEACRGEIVVGHEHHDLLEVGAAVTASSVVGLGRTCASHVVLR